MGAPLPIAPLVCIPTTAGTGSEVSMGGDRQGPRAQGEARDRRLPAVPAAGDPRPRGDEDAAAEDRRGHRHGRDDPRDRELRGAGVEPVPGGPLAGRAAADPGEPASARSTTARTTRRRAATCWWPRRWPSPSSWAPRTRCRIPAAASSACPTAWRTRSTSRTSSASTPRPATTWPTATATSATRSGWRAAARRRAVGDNLASHVTRVRGGAGPAHAAVAGGRARGRHPGAGGGRDGRRPAR